MRRRLSTLVHRQREALAWRWSRAIYGLQPSPAAQVFCVVSLAYMLCWNIRSTDYPRHLSWFPEWFNAPGYALRFKQYWGMFAPAPSLRDGWFVCVGRLSAGRDVDLLRDGAPLDWEKPELASALPPNGRWQKLLANAWERDDPTCRNNLLSWLSGSGTQHTPCS